MVKKQSGFQVASYLYPEDYASMRREVQSLQEGGWEVIGVRTGAVVQGEGTSTQINLLVSMIKYEWVDEPAPAAKVGRPKKDA